MSLKNTDVKTPGIAAIAKKWNLPVAHVAKLVEIGAKTEFEHNKNISKARQVARDHIAERPDYYQKLKKMEKSPVSMKEENSISAVRGLGYVTGDPAVDPVSQYIDTNAMAYEDQNGNVLRFMKKNGKESSLGFTPYNPTQDHGDIKTRILGKKIMKESNLTELSGGDSRDYEGGVSGLPKSAYRQNEIAEGEKLQKAKKVAGKAARGAVVAANLFTLGQVAGDAAEGRGSPKRSVIAATTAKSGTPGLIATGAHYGLKAKDFLKKKKYIEEEKSIDLRKTLNAAVSKSQKHYSNIQKALQKIMKEDAGRFSNEVISEIKATTVGSAIATAATRRKELTSKGHLSSDDVKKWWKYERLVNKGMEKLTGKTKVPPTIDKPKRKRKKKLEEYANTPSNEYTKPYITKSLVRTGRASHEHISKPDTIEEPGRGGKVSPNGEK